jgi:hypothetical protein
MLSSFTVNYIVALQIFPSIKKQNTKSKTVMPHSPDAMGRMAPGKDTEQSNGHGRENGAKFQDLGPLFQLRLLPSKLVMKYAGF